MLADKNIVFNEDNHFCCFAHIINLAIQDIIKLLIPNSASQLENDKVEKFEEADDGNEEYEEERDDDDQGKDLEHNEA